MRKSLVVLAVAGLLLGIAAVAASGSAPTAKWHLPTKSTVKIHRGGSVKWVWTGDGLDHNVKGPGFKSATSSKKGFSYTHKFDKKGTFTIVCGIHGSAMKTTVKVS
jgi:plastocyanin